MKQSEIIVSDEKSTEHEQTVIAKGNMYHVKN